MKEKEGIGINLIFHNRKFQGFKSYTIKLIKNILFYLIFLYLCGTISGSGSVGYLNFVIPFIGQPYVLNL